MNAIKKTLYLLLLCLIILPALQKLYPFFRVKSLNGAFHYEEKPIFTWAGWLSGSFQGHYNDYSEQHIGFRNCLVRLNNQIDFSLFRKTHAEGIAIGKDNVLYEYDYIRAYMGWDFIGEKAWDKKMGHFKFLQDYLKSTRNIDLMLVLEPSKVRFEPEYLPKQYLLSKGTVTNYEYILQKAKELDIRYLDLNKYFLLMKDTCRYLLYPKYGVHWSTYGMSLAADTLVKYIEQLHRIDMPDIYTGKIELSDSLRDTDYDAGKPLNLIHELPHGPMAYPSLRFEKNPDKIKPRVLVVGDSYYWNIYNTGLPDALFTNQNFWYFNAKVYPNSFYDSTYVRDLNIKKEIEKRDVILVMMTDRFLYKYDWGFIDQAFEAFTPELEPDRLYNYEDSIRGIVDFFDDLNEDVVMHHKSLEEVVRKEADYLFKTKNVDQYIEIYGPEYYEEIIRKDTGWMNNVIKKAELNKTTVDSMLRCDADYMFKKEHPDIHRKYLAVKENEVMIRSDSNTMKQVIQEAKRYYLTTDEMVWQEALQRYKEEIMNDALETDMEYYEKIIRNDPAWLNSVKEKALKQGVSLDEMIRLDAQWMFNQDKNKQNK
jgi:hypothetical protein